MDKDASQKIIAEYRWTCYRFKDSCRFGDEKDQEKYDNEMGAVESRLIEALTHTPVVRDSLTTDPKPQGEPREWWITKIKSTGIVSVISEDKPSDWILSHAEKFEVIRVREA